LCALFLDPSRDELLASYPWTFATRTVTLVLSSGSPPTRWAYAYAAPDRLLRAVAIDDGRFQRRPLERVPFEVGVASDLNALEIWTDRQNAALVFIARMETYALYPPAFVEALARLLAAKLVGPLTGLHERIGDYLALAERARDAAIAQDDRQRELGAPPVSSYVAERS
jgi:hypothetical protein